MRIGIIQASSQAEKNELIFNTVKKYDIKENQEFKESAKDKIMTEIFLQNFIINLKNVFKWQNKFLQQQLCIKSRNRL